jgi:hypothetical protein
VCTTCQSARGPDADRHAKLLIHLAVEGSLLDAYSHLIPDEAIEKLCCEGRGDELFPYRYPTWRYGIDPVTYPCFLLPPTIEELEAIEDKVHLASIIRDLDIRGTTPRIQKLIRSTVEPEWSWLGETVQGHLESEQEE